MRVPYFKIELIILHNMLSCAITYLIYKSKILYTYQYELLQLLKQHNLSNKIKMLRTNYEIYENLK